MCVVLYDYLNDVKTRIALAKDAFNKRKELLTKGLSRTLKTRLVKVLVWPVVLYGYKTWTLWRAEVDKLEALEMWIWRRLESVCWPDRIKNEEVLSMVGQKRCLVKTIPERKKNWIGHVLRGDGLLKDVLKGIMCGKRPQGRPRIGIIDNLMEGCFEKMKRRAEGKLE